MDPKLRRPQSADAARLEDCLDKDDPKAALVMLLVAHEVAVSGEAEIEMEALRACLRRLRFSALVARAAGSALAAATRTAARRHQSCHFHHIYI